MKTIAVTLQKGGTGKTSLAVSLAAELAQTAGSTLIIDCDPQGSASSWLAPDSLTAELADVLTKQAVLKDTVIQTAWANLSMLPSAGLGGTLKVFAETQAAQKPFCMKNLLKEVAALGFDYCVCDLSPGWGALERACALAADELITPIMPDIFGIDGLHIFHRSLADLREDMNLPPHKPAYTKIIVNAIDHRIGQHQEILSKIKEMEHAYQVYYVPVEPIFRKAQASQAVIQAMPGIKPETDAELKRLIQDIKE